MLNDSIASERLATLNSNRDPIRPRYRTHGKEYVRYGPRDWRYADDEEIQVPGGRDMRLSERFDPIIGSKGGEKQVVIIDGEDVESSPEVLGWALSVGTPVRNEKGNLLQVIVPYETWEAHDAIDGIMVAPELDGDENVRELAAAQLKLKKTERLLSKETAERDKLLVELAEAGMTRQRAAEITGMSVGKVQQIIKKEELAANELELARIVAQDGPIGISQIVDRAKATPGVTGSKTKLKKILTSLGNRGFVESSDGGHWSVTEKAEDELDKKSKEASKSPPSTSSYAAVAASITASSTSKTDEA